MENVLQVISVNDYARYVGAPVLHPLVSVVNYDELDHCRHALIEYGVYALFLMKESPYSISYGGGNYKFQSGFGLLLMGPAIATKRFFDTLDRIESKLDESKVTEIK